MARLPYLDRKDLAPEDQKLLDRNINLFRILTHSPNGTRAFHALGGYIRNGSKLDGRLRELAILQVGWLARSPYEWSHHVKIGKDFGVSDADIRALIAESDGKGSMLEPIAKTVLACAREMTNDGAASAATFAALEKGLNKADLTDLIITIAFYNAVVRFLGTMQIDVEPDYQTYLDQYPLPE